MTHFSTSSHETFVNLILHTLPSPLHAQTHTRVHSCQGVPRNPTPAVGSSRKQVQKNRERFSQSITGGMPPIDTKLLQGPQPGGRHNSPPARRNVAVLPKSRYSCHICRCTGCRRLHLHRIRVPSVLHAPKIHECPRHRPGRPTNGHEHAPTPGRP